MEFKQPPILFLQAAKEAEKIRLFMKIPISAPIDPIDAAIKCGCEVRLMKLSSLEGVYSPEPKPTIVLGSDRPAGRRSYTCAHELGHHVFKHGMRIEDLSEKKEAKGTSEEFLADAFAGMLLMSQTVILRSLKDRGWQASKLLPDQIYRLANYLGVGYSTLINHLALSLKLITREYAKTLLKVQPKAIKAGFGIAANSEMVIVDHHWQHKPIDVEVGDTIILPSDTEVEIGRSIINQPSKPNIAMYKAISPGFARAFCSRSKWAIHLRISRKKYVGLAEYRFLEESEAEE